MATIALTTKPASGGATLTETTLDGSSDTFSYTSGKGRVLILRNPTGSPISATIDGNGGTTVATSNLGSVDVSGGYAVGSIAAGAAHVINLDSIASYLTGTIAITSGSGLVASYF